MSQDIEGSKRHWALGTAQIDYEDGVARVHSADGAGADWFTRAPLDDINAAYEEIAKRGKFYLIIDLSDFRGKMPKLDSGDTNKLNFDHFNLTILVGMSLPVRLAVKAVMVGMALAGRPDTTRVTATLDEARKLIQEHREKHAA